MRRQFLTLMRDRRRRQRGSVLSGVLIITAFLAIISGALLTELSSNFLLSRVLTQRVAAEATLSSAIAIGVNQIESQSIAQGCPAIANTSLNGVSASVAYAGCAPTIDAATTPPFSPAAGPSGAAVDGTAVAGAYLTADTSGRFYRYAFGQTAPSWTESIAGSVTGPPAGVQGGGGALLPVASSAAGCGSSGYCVAQLEYPGTTPECYMPAAGLVTARPAAGISYPGLAFFGDRAKNAYAYDTISGSCPLVDHATTAQPVAAGPIVFAGPSLRRAPTDEVYFVASDSTGSHLVDYEFSTARRSFGLNPNGSWQLAAPNVVGMSADRTTLPARLAITFAGGMVQVLQVQAGSAVSLGQVQLPGGVAGAPAWCCGSSPSRIGVGAQNGMLYVLDPSAAVVASYQLGAAVNSTPTADAAGDWFAGADDGNVYEIPAVQATPTTLAFGTGLLGRLHSSVQVGACGPQGAWLCMYTGSASGVYLIDLDARQVTIWSCIGPSASACATGEPGLWTSLEIGSSSSPYTVRIQGWSYYTR